MQTIEESTRGDRSAGRSGRVARRQAAKLLAMGAIAMALVLATTLVADRDNRALATEFGTYSLLSPLSSTIWVTSTPRYHDGCEPYTSNYWDTPKFDDGTCHSAASGDFAMDFGASQDAYVYIDVNPAALDGFPAGGQYRIVAGDVVQWDSSANGKYQIFGIHVPDGAGGWMNYGWIVVGHINRFIYASGTVIAGPTTGHSVVAVAQVAPAGTWPVHLHFETYTNNGYSRPYDWDGPTNADDTSLSGPCNRSGSSATATRRC